MNENSIPAATRVRNILIDSLFTPQEIGEGNQPPEGAILISGIMLNMAFHPERLESHRAEVLALIDEIVVDSFLKEVSGGWSFLELCNDRAGEMWTGDHRSMEEFYLIAAGLGYAGFCAPREMWGILPGGLPYIWFSKTNQNDDLPSIMLKQES